MSNPARMDNPASAWVRVGQLLFLWDYVAFGGWRGEVEVQGFSVRLPEEHTSDVLVVVRGLGIDGGPVVAFHSQPGVAESLAGAAKRVSEGHVRWRDDEYRK